MPETQTIDRHQVRTMVRNALRLDWRGTPNPLDSMRSGSRRIPGFAVVLIFNIAFSVIMGMAFVVMNDFTDALVLSAIGAFILVALQVLIEYSQIIITPDDYYVIAPHPVNSKTYYVAKLTHLLIYVLILCGSVTLVPSIIAAVTRGTILALPVVWIHYAAVSIFGALFMMVIFTAALRTVNRRKMERVMGYVQMGFILIFYAGFYILPGKLREMLTGVQLTDQLWPKFLPSYWYASWVRLVTDGWDWTLFGFGLLGIGLLALLAKLALSYLSLSYARSLTGSVDTGPAERRRILPAPLRRLWYAVTDPETRAVAMLTRAQFRHDMPFRMQVIWIVPVTLFAVAYGAVRGMSMPDPFLLTPDMDREGGMLFGIIIIMAPFMLHVGMIQSKAWKGAWIFHACPLDRVRLVLAAKRIVLLLMAGPILLFLWGFYSWMFGSILHGLMHAVFLLALATVGETLINTISVRMPFATEKAFSGFSAEAIGAMIAIWVVAGVPLTLVNLFGYGGYTGWGVLVGLAFLAVGLLTPVQQGRIRSKIREWELEG